MDTQTWIYTIAMVVLICFSAYFSATETAFTSVNRIRIKNMASDGNKKAKKVQDLSENYDNLLSTILIGNNIVNILTTVIATLLFVDLCGKAGPTVATVVTTLLVLIFGEITPKSLAKESPEKFSMFSSGFIGLLMIILTPLTFIFSKWKQFVVRIFHVNPGKGVTEEELITMVEEAEDEGEFDEERSELIQNAIEFGSLEAWDILTPRVSVVAIDINESKEEIRRIFKETGYSRLPVYDDDIDKLLGVLNQKDFHNHIYDNSEAEISEYLAPIVTVNWSRKISSVLKIMQEEKTHMSAVIDEYGGMIGIITMEDIIEEIVGDIYDEHDAVIAQEIVPMAEGGYRIKANIDIDKMFDFFDVEDETDVNTVNGWVVSNIDKLPETGDKFEYICENKRFTCTVTKADERKALEIKLEVEELPQEDE